MDAKEFDYSFDVVLAMGEEVVHVGEEQEHGGQVEEAKEHEAPVEDQGALEVDGFKHSTVVADVEHEGKEELISPFIVLGKLIQQNKYYHRHEYQSN